MVTCRRRGEEDLDPWQPWGQKRLFDFELPYSFSDYDDTLSSGCSEAANSPYHFNIYSCRRTLVDPIRQGISATYILRPYLLGNARYYAYSSGAAGVTLALYLQTEKSELDRTETVLDRPDNFENPGIHHWHRSALCLSENVGQDLRHYHAKFRRRCDSAHAAQHSLPGVHPNINGGLLWSFRAQGPQSSLISCRETSHDLNNVTSSVSRALQHRKMTRGFALLRTQLRKPSPKVSAWCNYYHASGGAHLTLWRSTREEPSRNHPALKA